MDLQMMDFQQAMFDYRTASPFLIPCLDGSPWANYGNDMEKKVSSSENIYVHGTCSISTCLSLWICWLYSYLNKYIHICVYIYIYVVSYIIHTHTAAYITISEDSGLSILMLCFFCDDITTSFHCKYYLAMWVIELHISWHCICFISHSFRRIFILFML